MAFFPMDRRVLLRMTSSLFGFIAAAIIAVLYLYDYSQYGPDYDEESHLPDLGFDKSQCRPSPPTSPAPGSDSLAAFPSDSSDDAFSDCTYYNHKKFFSTLYRIATGILAIIIAIIEIILLLPDSLKIPAVLRPLLDCPITRGFFYLYVGAMTFNVAGNLGSSAAVISCFVGLLVLCVAASPYA